MGNQFRYQQGQQLIDIVADPNFPNINPTIFIDGFRPVYDYLFNWVEPTRHYVNGELHKITMRCPPCQFPRVEFRDVTNGEENATVFEQFDIYRLANNCLWTDTILMPGCTAQHYLDAGCSNAGESLFVTLSLTCDPIPNADPDPVQRCLHPVLEAWTISLSLFCCSNTEVEYFIDTPFFLRPAICGPSFIVGPNSNTSHMFAPKVCGTSCTDWSDTFVFTVDTINGEVPLCTGVQLQARICGYDHCSCDEVNDILQNACDNFIEDDDHDRLFPNTIKTPVGFDAQRAITNATLKQPRQMLTNKELNIQQVSCNCGGIKHVRLPNGDIHTVHHKECPIKRLKPKRAKGSPACPPGSLRKG